MSFVPELVSTAGVSIRFEPNRYYHMINENTWTVSADDMADYPIEMKRCVPNLNYLPDWTEQLQNSWFIINMFVGMGSTSDILVKVLKHHLNLFRLASDHINIADNETNRKMFDSFLNLKVPFDKAFRDVLLPLEQYCDSCDDKTVVKLIKDTIDDVRHLYIISMVNIVIFEKIL